MKDLLQLRQEIDQIDRQLVALFEQRMNTVLQVAEYKLANGLPVLNAGREQQVLEQCAGLLQNQAYRAAVIEWIQLTMALSRSAQASYLEQHQSGL